MTEQNKVNAVEAKAAEATTVIVDLTETQVEALKILGIFEDRNKIAESAFASALRGKVESANVRAIKAKYEAEQRGKKAVAAELEAEIQAGIALKRKL